MHDGGRPDELLRNTGRSSAPDDRHLPLNEHVVDEIVVERFSSRNTVSPQLHKRRIARRFPRDPAGPISRAAAIRTRRRSDHLSVAVMFRRAAMANHYMDVLVLHAGLAGRHETLTTRRMKRNSAERHRSHGMPPITRPGGSTGDHAASPASGAHRAGLGVAHGTRPGMTHGSGNRRSRPAHGDARPVHHADDSLRPPWRIHSDSCYHVRPDSRPTADVRAAGRGGATPGPQGTATGG